VPSRLRVAPTGAILHVLNRGVRRSRIFDDSGDYRAFIAIVSEAQHRHPLAIFAYCLMPSHFHFVVQPSADGQLSQFMQWLTATHSKRWHAHRGTYGTGSVYQGRFKAIPVQSDEHFLIVSRYVERNPLRAGLVTKSRDWPWSSFSQRCKNCNEPALQAWPILQPDNWEELLDTNERIDGLRRLRLCVRRNRPFGAADWVEEQRRRKDLGGPSLQIS
jgi:REP-associated tyrosine transposase